MALLLAALTWTTGPVSADAAASPTWSAVSPALSPPALSEASMAYDSDNDTLVLFGGVTAEGSLSSATWVWNGSSWSRTLSSVPAREHASMAFDPALHQLILFGGAGPGGQLLDDTWAWNGASWYQEGAQGTGQTPPAREGASLAFDTNDQLVLYGGSTAASTGGTTSLPVTSVLGDTWVWTGSSWAEQTVTDPPARTDAGMAWDPMTSSTVMFGGSSSPTGTSASPGLLGETWTWGAGSWTQLAPAASPPAAQDLDLVADPDLGGVLAVGLAGATTPSSATWVWNGQTWAPLATAGNPAARQGAAAAYDAAAHQLVVFGGLGADGSTLGDTEILTAAAPPTATTQPTTTTTSVPSAGGSHQTSTTTVPGAKGRPSSPSTTTIPKISTTTLAAKSSAPHLPAAQQLHPGALMTLRGTGFQPDAPITITFHSTPFLVGRTTADVNGSFTATVAVPTNASSGLHHFEASGMGDTGTVLLQVTPVEVVDAIVHHSTVLRTLAMVAISVALPAGTWLLMELRGRRRTRLRTA